MELKLGKMTSQEIAQWMGISYSTYRNKVYKYIEKLKLFADFEQIRGGVIIHNIIIPEYIKDFSKDSIDYYNMIKNKQDYLASVSGTAKEFKNKKDDYKNLSDDTAKYRVRKARITGFGVASDSNSKGIYGTCHYIWAVRLGDNNYRKMTIEEQQEYEKFKNNYKNIDKSLEDIALVQQATEEQDASDEDLIKKAKEIGNNFYTSVIVPFMEKTNLLIVSVAEHELFEKQINFEGEKENE